MEQTIQILPDSLRALKQPTNTPTDVCVYKDRAILSIQKYPLTPTSTNKSRNLFTVKVQFVYEGKPMETVQSYRGLKTAMNYATNIFTNRNAYMLKHDYKL